MDVKRVRGQKTGIDGIVDVGLIVISHCKNPAQKVALDFLKEILTRRKQCLIPVSCFLGAYFILTDYLHIDEDEASKLLRRTLETQSQAFYEDIDTSMGINSLRNASKYLIESWDGYLVAIAKAHSTSKIYSLDKKLERKIDDINVINPLSKKITRKYHKWVSEQTN